MKKPGAFLTAAVLAAMSLFSPVPQSSGAEAAAADQVSIMPIGDSITFGYGQGQDGGYRKFLDVALKEKDIGFDMVGPEGSNSASFSYNGQTVTYDNNHAGYSGYTIKQQYPIPSWGENGLLEVLQKKNAVSSANPDIVLLIIGTNDMTANRDLTACESDLHDLIDYMLENMQSDSVIFMGSIPEFTAYGGNTTRVGNYNAVVKKVAESYGDNVRFADVHGCLNGAADLQDDKLHPNAEGYEKMGRFWADVIEEYLSGQSGTADPDSPEILHSTFESGLGGWTGRGGAGVAVSKEEAAEGAQSALCSGRQSAWHGIAYSLSSSKCPAGSLISVTAQVKQTTGAPVHFKMTMQYTTDGGAVYDTFAEGDAASGEWLTLSAVGYEMKTGTNPVLYIETSTDTCDFYLDEVIVTKYEGTAPPSGSKKGDADGNGAVELADAVAMVKFLLGEESAVYVQTADLDGDGKITAKDLTMLKQKLLEPEQEIPVYMSQIRDQVTATVPDSVLKNAEGGLEHITYFSKKANRNKGANVWLPPGYDESQTYPVFYVNHGYGGDEGSMVNGMGVREIATNLIKSGDAVPMIIVFTNQYTDPDHEKQTGDGQADVPGYDNFVEDLPDSLMPYIESHYPVKTGRENTAIAGFSMGGREALYCGMKCCDRIGYIGGGAPAPGIFPTQDQFMSHPGVMSKDDMRIDPPYAPYLLMIAGGTADGMVNDYPKQYADLFTAHGTDNIFISVPGGGHDSSTVIPLMYNFIRFLFKA